MSRIPSGASAWALRHFGDTGRARELQQALRSELDALGLEDPNVDEELPCSRAEPQSRR